MAELALADFARRCQVAEIDKFIRNCEKLHELLQECNKLYNLTRIVDKSDFEVKHIIDSLAIALDFPEIAEEKLHIADIGCGAGFPSLILALAYPALEICAIDSTGKKINFVRQAAEALSLKNVHPTQGRSVELNRKKEFQGKFDIVTARAVAPAEKISSESSNFLTPDGRYILYKTPAQKAEEEKLLAKDNKFLWSYTAERQYEYGSRLFFVGRRRR